MDAEGEEFGGLEEVELALQEKGIGAEVDVLFAGDETFHDLVDFGMDERLPAGDGNHGGAALIGGRPALFRSEALAENVVGILDFSATCAGEVAAEEGFEHENERIAFVSAQFLPENIGSDGPCLTDGNWHIRRKKATNPESYVNGSRMIEFQS